MISQPQGHEQQNSTNIHTIIKIFFFHQQANKEPLWHSWTEHRQKLNNNFLSGTSQLTRTYGTVHAETEKKDLTKNFMEIFSST
jgi:hypothetical protein